MENFDAIVIGAGQAGPALTARATAAGWKVAVIERDRPGGTCVNYGCIPTKTLVASARVAHQVARSSEYGVRLPGAVGFDIATAYERMRRISGKSHKGVTGWLEHMENAELIRGHARFVGPDTIEVGERQLQAERIFLNVGGRARTPDWQGLSEVPFLTNVEILHQLDELPEHLIVVGGSYIGLEFAQMFRRFGSRVTVIQRGPRIVQREDADVSAAIHDILTAEGIDVRLNSTCFEALPDPAGVRVRVDCQAAEPEVVGSHLLVAVGRVPNTDDLGLENAGVRTDARGYIEVDDRLRTSASGIWALGDWNGRGAFTHTAYNDYEIVAANLFDGDDRRLTDRHPCYALFTDPPLGRVGMTVEEARERGHRILLGQRSMEDVGRAVENGETAGFMRVVVDADSERILGATILGIGGDEIVHTLLALMYADVPYTVLSRSVPIHPTVAELLPTVLQSLKPVED